MTAATVMHLADETLAAYLDRQLDDAARASVMEHLAFCDECRSKIIEVNRTLKLLEHRSDVEPSNSSPLPESEELVEPEPRVFEKPPGTARVHQRPKNRWRWTIAAAAAAAVIAVVLLGPMRDSIFGSPGIPTLVEASNQLETRRTFGRLSGGFPYKEMMRINRNAGDSPDGGTEEILNNLPLLEAQEKIESASRPDPHARGVAKLLLGKRLEAVETLRAILLTNPPNRDAVAQDLAVALLQDGKYKDSLEISNELWSKHRTPEIAWNRAYALQQDGQYEQAIAAWNEYLQLDPKSEWTQEAINQKQQAIEDLKLDRDLELRRSP
jgi:tetratricopeptide (TPR) repeat protein